MYNRITNPFRPDLCQLTERSHDFGPRRPKIYLVTTAVGSIVYEKQLVEVLRDVLSNSQCTLVCSEAADGDASRPSGWISDAQAESMLNGGQLHATTYLQTRGELDFLLWGVDEMALYRQSSEILLRHRQENKAWSALIGEVDHRGEDSLLGRVMEVAQLSAEWADLLVPESIPNMTDLLQLARAESIDVHPLLFAFGQSTELQERIDFPKANQEAMMLFEQLLTLTVNANQTLKQLLEREAPETSGLFLKPEAFESAQSSSMTRLIRWDLRQTGKPPPESGDQLAAAFFKGARHLWQGFLGSRQRIYDSSMREAAKAPVVTEHLGSLNDSLSFLIDLLPLLGLDSGKFPNLVLYVRSLRPVATANINDALPLVDELQQQLIDHLATPLQREYIRLAKRLQRIKGLAALQVTHADLALILKDPILVDHARICAGVRAAIGDHSLALQLEGQKEQYQLLIEDAKRWVRIHTKRSEVMAEKSLVKMAALGLTQAVLLVTGFHEAPIVSLLLARQVSCIVLRPIIKQAVSEREWDIYLGSPTWMYDLQNVQ